MELFIAPNGRVKAIYGEEIPLEELGNMSIARASFVEPDPGGGWQVDLSPVHGPVLGPFRYRSLALDAERQWLLAHHFPNPMPV